MTLHAAGGGPPARSAVVVQYRTVLPVALLPAGSPASPALTPCIRWTSVAIELLDRCAGAGPAVALLRHRSAVEGVAAQRYQAVSVDVSVLAPTDLDGIGEFVESGRTVLLGVVPTTAPVKPPAVEEVARAAAAVTDRLGFARGVARPRRRHARLRTGRCRRSLGEDGHRAVPEDGDGFAQDWKRSSGNPAPDQPLGRLQPIRGIDELAPVPIHLCCFEVQTQPARTDPDTSEEEPPILFQRAPFGLVDLQQDQYG